MSASKNRIAAFTIMEVMVALVLTALAMSFIFAGIRFVQRQSASLTHQLEASGEIDRFYYALQTDVHRTSEIRYQQDGIVFSEMDTAIHYLPADSICIRYTRHLTDTFRVSIDSISCWFAGRRQETQGGPIDELSVYLTQHNRPLSVWVQKPYDMAARMRLTDSLALL